jgi:hypothetical protein
MARTAHTDSHKQRTPRGVILIGILLIIGAFFTGGMMLVPTQTLAEFNLPRSLLFFGALITGLLAYGLLRLRRWAWAATLSFIVVNAYFLILNAALRGTVQYAGLIVLVVAGIYLLLPSVRSSFLRPGK